MMSNLRSDDQLKAYFRPEFLNRIDEVLHFQPLGEEQIVSIVDVQLERMSRHLAEQEIELDVSLAAKEELAKEGVSPEFGARPLKRVLQKRVQNLLADGILRGTLGRGDRAEIDVVDGVFTLEVRRSASGAAEDAAAAPSEPESAQAN